MLRNRLSTRYAALDTCSNMSKILRPSAASRIAIWTTLAFALGTALAFSILYILVSRNIRERGDAWLSGEAEFLPTSLWILRKIACTRECLEKWQSLRLTNCPMNGTLAARI